jgi:hypothetical protein
MKAWTKVKMAARNRIVFQSTSRITSPTGSMRTP